MKLLFIELGLCVYSGEIEINEHGASDRHRTCKFPVTFDSHHLKQILAYGGNISLVGKQ